MLHHTNKIKLKVLFLEVTLSLVEPEDLREYLEDTGVDFNLLNERDWGLFDSYFNFYGRFDRDFGNEEKEEDAGARDNEMARILEVDPDADKQPLKVAHRKLALRFHPDKWKSRGDHGMTREESQEHFKRI